MRACICFYSSVCKMRGHVCLRTGDFVELFDCCCLKRGISENEEEWLKGAKHIQRQSVCV